jgi:hypothetical protein
MIINTIVGVILKFNIIVMKFMNYTEFLPDKFKKVHHWTKEKSE